MDRRDLLKSIAGIAAITPIVPRKDDEGTAQAYELKDDKPFYLFVVDASQCGMEDFVSAFRIAKIRGGVVAAHGDLDNFCRIYKLEE